MRIKNPRIHDEGHLRFIRDLSCVSCMDNTSTEAAHLRSGSLKHGKRETGMGEKPSDCWTLPLCSACHREQHDVGERDFFEELRIDPFVLAPALHRVSGDHELAEKVIEAHKSELVDQ